MVEHTSTAEFPTKYGDFTIYGFTDPAGEEIVVLTIGDVSGDGVLVRVHSGCVTGEVFHSLRCDCGNQLEVALKKIVQEGRGILIYLPGHEGRGIGLINKLKAYKLQDEGLDTVDANVKLGFEADQRAYDFIPEILNHFGAKSIRLLTNNPEKIKALDEADIKVVREPLIIPSDVKNESYMEAKKNRMGHMLDEE